MSGKVSHSVDSLDVSLDDLLVFWLDDSLEERLVQMSDYL